MDKQNKDYIQQMEQNYPSELLINMMGFELQDVTPDGCCIEMTQDVCMLECFPEEAPNFTRTITMRVKMPLPDMTLKTYDGFHMYYQQVEDPAYQLGYFYTLPQAVKYFKDNFAKIARKISAYGTEILYMEGFNFEKSEIPEIYTDDTVNIKNLFEEV